MDGDRDALIRKKAYEIWEREGRSGDPEDHRVRAEREIDGDASRTSVEEALPTDSVAAADSAIR